MESLKPTEQGYQVPEPWNGDLEKADILFLSSNPGINVFEKFPRYIGSSSSGVFRKTHTQSRSFPAFMSLETTETAASARAA